MWSLGNGIHLQNRSARFYAVNAKSCKPGITSVGSREEDIRMTIRSQLRFGVSASALTLALTPTLAAAQDVSANPSDTEETEPATEELAPETPGVVITGFRASLQSAVDEKKRQEQIVESVSAEDIGKLPDNSIGESIARLPGITSQRLNGRANVIAIRGFGPDFSQTLLNGREQTSTGDNRAVEFDQYPSEIVSQVVVYKTPSAALVGQGLVGTVDIRTIRPLEYGKSVLAVGARGSYADLGKLNAGSKEFGYRVNGTYVDQFADDTLGIALSASYVDEPYQVQEFNAWGYAGGQGPNADGSLIGGSKSFVTSTGLKRFGAQATVQYRPTDHIVATLDGFYSNFKDEQFKRGVELPLAFGDFFGTRVGALGPVSPDGTVTTATFTNVEGVVRNDIFEREADLYSGGLNLTYDGENGWKAFFDFGYSRTDRNELSLESYSGTGYNRLVGTTDTIGYTATDRGARFTSQLDYSNPAFIKLTDPLGWGGNTLQAGYFNNRIVEDELKQYRVEVAREFGGNLIDAVRVGLNYTDRDKSLTPDESFVTLPVGQLEADIPAEFLLNSTQLSYLGLGPVVSYDARRLIDAGVLRLLPNAVNDVFAKAFTISEDLMTAYGQVDIRSQLGSAEVTGNVGVQAIFTDQGSTGFVFGDSGPQTISLGDDYTDVLPSLNLSLRTASDFVVRFAAAREIQRPRLDDLRVSIGFGPDTAAGNIIRGSGGNPSLRPYRANAVDLTLEKYFGGNEGYVALQLFYKDIKSYINQGRFPFDFSAFPITPGVVTAGPIGTLDAPTNTGGGDFYGAEAGFTLPFSVFSGALDGFGVTGGAGYTKTKIEDQNGERNQIPGYSKWVANGTALFEKAGFSARGSVRYRSTFLGDFTGFGGSPTRRRALEELLVDAQLGYDFTPSSALSGLSVYLQGQNLTDERFASVTDTATPLQVIDYQIYGRRFLAGFTFKF